MTKKEIIDGLKFTVEMFLFDPSTGEDIPKHLLNDDTRTTVEACEGAIALLSGGVPDTNVGELIRREDAIAETERNMSDSISITRDDWRAIVDGLKEIPSVSSLEIPNSSGNHFADSDKMVDGDLISRNAAIDALAKFVPYAICNTSTESYANGLTDAYNLICQLPSAQPERIKGHWIVKHGSDAPPICDKCGYESRTTIKEVVDQNLKMIYYTGIDIKSSFCPNCGADMRGKQDERPN